MHTEMGIFFVSRFSTKDNRIRNATQKKPSKNLQAANPRNGVVFCFNEDLHGPKSESFLSVNAANQEEEESNYTPTCNRAQCSQAKENFIYDVILVSDSDGLRQYHAHTHWDEYEVDCRVHIQRTRLLIKVKGWGVNGGGHASNRTLLVERPEEGKGISWELDLEELYRIGRKNKWTPQADSEEESKVVHCEERRLPVQNSRPRRRGFEIENTNNHTSTAHESQIYAECGSCRDGDVDLPRMEERRKPEFVPDIGIKFRSTGEME
ncbi:hypothetical protein B0H13DRAFT_1903348 [Mycena leptocephala]|nr:hypothetical protein B0H13DRAFT_1903348 [Mycena leptocephala]